MSPSWAPLTGYDLPQFTARIDLFIFDDWSKSSNEFFLKSRTGGGDRIFLVKDEASGDNFGRFDEELDILDMD